MQALSNLSLRLRLLVSFGLILLLALGQGLLGMHQTQAINGKSSEVSGRWLPSVRFASALATDVASFRIAQFQHVLSNEAQSMDAVEVEMGKVLAQVDKNRAAYAQLMASDAERQLFAAFEAQWSKYLAAHPAMLKLSRERRTAGALAVLNGEAHEAFMQASAALQKLVDWDQAGADLATQESGTLYQAYGVATVAVLVLMAACGLVVALRTSAGLSRGVAEAQQASEAIAEGALDQPIDTRHGAEIGQLLRALLGMQTRLASIVQGVRSSSQAVAISSNEIAGGNQDLSMRTEQQASALQEAAASMEQLSATVRQNADSAYQANQLALEASAVAQKGGEVVGQAVETMKGINDSSRKISDIIQVIDGIAFQTNILALNAAVEAARAGEQGRGFAVVASEVRSLAGRSATAAKEIKALISASVERVEQGSRQVDQAGITMAEVVRAIARVTQLVGEISAASSEQATGVAQVGQAVAQMDQVTQQNAALVEQMAACAMALNAQAQDLVASVSVFQLDTIQA